MTKARLTFIKDILTTPRGEYTLYLPKSSHADGVRLAVNAAFGSETPLLQVLSINEYAVSPQGQGRYSVLKRGGGDAVTAAIAPFTKVMEVRVDHAQMVIGQLVGETFDHEAKIIGPIMVGGGYDYMPFQHLDDAYHTVVLHGVAEIGDRLRGHETAAA